MGNCEEGNVNRLLEHSYLLLFRLSKLIFVCISPCTQQYIVSKPLSLSQHTKLVLTKHKSLQCSSKNVMFH